MMALEKQGDAGGAEVLEKLRAHCFRAIDHLRVAHDVVSEDGQSAGQLLIIVYRIADFLDEMSITKS